MRKVINIFKPVSFTPLEVIQGYCAEFVEYKGLRLGYAGRLDPMASGVLLVLVGDENLRRKTYERLPKEYEFEVLFGVSTDTFDVMGEIVETSAKEVSVEDLKLELLKYIGEWEQEYPPYSSARVSGKPLYFWARRGRIHEVVVPKKRIEVFSLEVVDAYSLSREEVISNAVSRIKKVHGDFRQEKIILGWEKMRSFKTRGFQIVKFRASCSSGVYVRGIANMMGIELKVPALAYSIRRTRVGDFRLSSSVYLDSIR